MTVTSSQIMQVCNCTDAEMHRLRQIMGIAGTGSGRRMTYDEEVADVLVTIWSIQSSYLTAGKHGVPWSILTELGEQFLADPDSPAVWARGIVTITARQVIHTDWSTVECEPISRLER